MFVLRIMHGAQRVWIRDRRVSGRGAPYVTVSRAARELVVMHLLYLLIAGYSIKDPTLVPLHSRLQPRYDPRRLPKRATMLREPPLGIPWLLT